MKAMKEKASASFRHIRKPAGYREDLAFIHDQGFSSFSMNAGAWLSVLFRRSSLPGVHVVELGCGSGRLARFLLQRGFAVTGVDASRSMIALAKRHATGGRFFVNSLWKFDIPQCAAVLAIGEVLNYQFKGAASTDGLRRLFSRVHDALLPSGLLIFDILCTRDSAKTVCTKTFTESDRWFVAVEKSDSRQSLTRRITSFRRNHGVYRKSVEVHRVHRYNLGKVVSILRTIGFRVSTRRGYRKGVLGEGRMVIIARKPSQ